MIEHPEAVTIARQIDGTLTGKRIASALRGNTPHKWAFYSRPAEEYASILAGASVTGAEPSGSLILVRVDSGHILVLGGGGERIRFHPPPEALPAKHQLALTFEDGASFSVKVQGWGSCQLWTQEQLQGYGWYANRSLEPTDPGFTEAYFTGLFAPLRPDEARSVKCFLITEPGVWGIGNGYLQDILLRARTHPRVRAVDTTSAQRRDLYRAIRETIDQAVALNGRTDELDLFGDTGSYARLLHSKVTGQPCPSCGEGTVEKASFLGGAVYTCPLCQPAPPKPPRRSNSRKKSTR